MLLFVIGSSSRFAEWCRAITLRFAERALGRSEVIHANTLEEIARNLLRSDVAHGVVASYQPGGGLRRALMEAGQPFVVALDDPRAALADLVTRHTLGIATATRTVGSSCASSICFSATPGALVLRADRAGGDPLSTAAAIARHLRLDLGDGEIADIVRSLGADGGAFEAGDAAAWWDGLDQAERTIADGALDPYLDLSTGRGLGPLTWAPELFFLGDRPTEPATGSIDITGRVRCLLRGPQIMLPPAIWTLSAAFHVSPDAAEHSFLLEATAGAPLSYTVIRPAAAGIVEADLTLTLDDLPDQPVDLHLSSMRPAFGGHLTLLRVTLTPQPEVPSNIPAEAGTAR